MTLDPTKWEIQNDKDIRYIGPVHTAGAAVDGDVDDPVEHVPTIAGRRPD